MPLYFITGSAGKYREVHALLPDVEQVRMHLPEIQELDSCKIVAEKLRVAQSLHPGPLMIEDTSLSIDDLNGLPGPLIKWFEQALGLEGIARLAPGSKVTAHTLIGYSARGTTSFYEGTLRGTIVMPRGDNGFGWDTIFLPDGSDKTMAELSLDEKNQISMRRQAVLKLKDALRRMD